MEFGEGFLGLRRSGGDVRVIFAGCFMNEDFGVVEGSKGFVGGGGEERSIF